MLWRSIRLGIALFCTLTSPVLMADIPRILIKINAQGNAEQLVNSVDKYTQNLSKQIPYTVLVASDLDEQILSSPELKTKLQGYPNLTILSSHGKSKTEAYNLGISDHADKFDIVLVTSDELEPAAKDYDKLIVESFGKNFNDRDGVLNILSLDKESINAAPVIGKAYYQRFGYVYNPIYQSSSYDKELTFASRILGKEAIVTQAILKPAEQPRETQKSISPRDEILFHKRRLKNFDIDEATLQKLYPKDWSILICTLDERATPFSHIYNKLQKQIQDNHLEDKVEIIVFKDNRENTVGFKRNALLRQSRGTYVNFIDDDDDLHDNYVGMIYEKLKSKPDCVSLVGIITFNDQNPTKFIHSVKFKTYFQANGIYFRPPNHLNTMKRSTAAQFLFPAISYGEDTDWAMRISRAGLLNKEEEITVPYYFYKFVDKKK